MKRFLAALLLAAWLPLVSGAFETVIDLPRATVPSDPYDVNLNGKLRWKYSSGIWTRDTCHDRVLIVWDATAGMLVNGVYQVHDAGYVKTIERSTSAGTANSVNLEYGGDTVTIQFPMAGQEDTSTWSPINYVCDDYTIHIPLVESNIEHPVEPPIPGQVYDNYVWTFQFTNESTNNFDIIASSSGWDEGTVLHDQVANAVNVFSTYEAIVQRDSADDHPTSISLLYTDQASGIGSSVNAYFVDSSGITESGGIVYTADISLSFGGGDPTDPETPPIPIDPTDPPDPLDPGVPDDPSPGGDTDPEVATNYEAFRDAMEDALDNRELSKEELHEAFQDALKEQGLSITNMQLAVSNALKQNKQTQEGQRDAVQSALDRQGLSGSNLKAQLKNGFGEALDQRNLNADAIGQSVADKMGGTNGNADVVAALGNIEQLLKGDSLGGIGTNGVGELGTNLVDTGIVESASNMVAKTDGTIGFIEEWFGNFFSLVLPDSLGQSSVMVFEVPNNAPGGLEMLPDTVEVNLENFQGLPIVRLIELACLHLFGVFTAVRIYKATW